MHVNPDQIVVYGTAIVTFLQVVFGAWKKLRDSIGK